MRPTPQRPKLSLLAPSWDRIGPRGLPTVHHPPADRGREAYNHLSGAAIDQCGARPTPPPREGEKRTKFEAAGRGPIGRRGDATRTVLTLVTPAGRPNLSIGRSSDPGDTTRGYPPDSGDETNRKTSTIVTCSPRLKAGAFSGCDMGRLPDLLPLADPPEGALGRLCGQ
jgi:hypothetical protein